jgi:aryl-alcohol dehydrogenase-like predicted oxidoreductase
MKYLDVDGVRVSAIGLGTWQFGSRAWGYGPDYAAHVAPALVRRALELGITLVDSATTTAHAVSALLAARSLDRTEGHEPEHLFLATDAPDRFARVGEIFLGRAIDPVSVELIDLQ